MAGGAPRFVETAQAGAGSKQPLAPAQHPGLLREVARQGASAAGPGGFDTMSNGGGGGGGSGSSLFGSWGGGGE
jgi:hypothetical protein